MSEIKCKCNGSFPENEFTSHFTKCLAFKNYFREFDIEFGNILKKYSEEKTNLFILRILLKQYVVVLEKKIKTQ